MFHQQTQQRQQNLNQNPQKKETMNALDQAYADAQKSLSNFTGYDGDNYDGYNDEFVDFSDFNGLSQAFATEIQSNRVLTVTITNAEATASTFYLTKGYKTMAEVLFSTGTSSIGTAKQGTFKSIENTDLSGAASPATLNELVMFANLNPMRVVGFKLTSAESTNHEQILEVEQLSLFKNLGTKPIYISTYRNENTYKDNITTVPVGFDLNNQTAIKMSIAGTSTMTFTFIFGAILNPAKALENKRKRAKASGKIQGQPLTRYDGFSND